MPRTNRLIDRARSAMGLGLMLGVFGCSGLLMTSEEGGRRGDVTSAETRAEEQPPEPPERASKAPSVARPSDVALKNLNVEPAPRGVVGIALKHVGAPYRWGGSAPDGFDCSGFVQYVYARVGISIPHNVAQQYRYGAPVPRDQLKPGDLVFFDRLRHNGIYIGQGRFIHARQTGKHVSVSTLDEDWYRSRWVGARRL